MQNIKMGRKGERSIEKQLKVFMSEYCYNGYLINRENSSNYPQKCKCKILRYTKLHMSCRNAAAQRKKAISEVADHREATFTPHLLKSIFLSVFIYGFNKWQAFYCTVINKTRGPTEHPFAITASHRGLV